jgi:hypothetical protein
LYRYAFRVLMNEVVDRIVEDFAFDVLRKVNTAENSGCKIEPANFVQVNQGTGVHNRARHCQDPS